MKLNNGWKDLSDSDFTVTLEEPDKDGICRGTSSLEFAKFMPHNLMALNFKIEYVANLPLKPSKKQVSYILGWQTMLPALNQ